MLIPVSDPDDPRLAGFRQVRERDLVGREGRFIAEGEVVLRVLLERARHKVEALLIAEKRLDALADLMALVPEQVPVYAAGQAVMDAVTGFHIHRGILALGRREPWPTPEVLLGGLGDGAVVLVLSAIANHDNMGGLLRNAAAFGADAVILDDRCCDPLYRKAIRVSVGAALVMPMARLEAGRDLIDLLQRFAFTPIALSPSASRSLQELERPARAALLLGAEGPGLAKEVIDRALAVRIPMSGGMDSLNVATAGGIALYHLSSAPPRPSCP
jgi:tRNA G18 (ribose-2'-O)-methylase SpoU